MAAVVTTTMVTTLPTEPQTLPPVVRDNAVVVTLPGITVDDVCFMAPYKQQPWYL